MSAVDKEKPYNYNNDNHHLCQIIINCIADPGVGVPANVFASYVEDNILKPMNIDTNMFSTDPKLNELVNINEEPTPTAARYYSGPADTTSGIYLSKLGGLAAAGFYSNATEVCKFVAALRNTTVLDQSTIQYMLEEGLGWFPWQGLYGRYYEHNGEQIVGSQGLETALFRLTNGFDCVLFSNSLNTQLASTIVEAFETRNS